MNKRQFEVEKSKLEDEGDVLRQLKSQYDTALNDINNNVKVLQQDIADLSTELQVAIDNGDTAKALIIKSRIQAKVYRRGYQQALKGQIDGIVDRMNKNQYSTIQSYLRGCYDSGFVGAMYDIAGQGVPIILPLSHKAISDAVKLDPKLSKRLYAGNIAELKSKIRSKISIGLMTGQSYVQIAQNLKNQSKIALNNTMRIVRTEGHRIQQVSADDARRGAVKAGADILKQWDAAMDKRTRSSHAAVDGEIRKIDEPFSNGLMFAGDPDGAAAEVINCRCATLSRARWALGEDELEQLKKRAEYFGLDKTESFEDFKQKYLRAVEDEKSNKVIKFKDDIKNWSSVENKGSGRVEIVDKITVEGTELKVDGRAVVFEENQNERRIAELLSKKYGKVVYRLPRVNYPQGISTPDYLIDGANFDLKTISSAGKNVLYNSLHGKKAQAQNYIFDVSRSNLSGREIVRQVTYIYASNHMRHVDTILIIRGDEIILSYTRK